jgi:hypothetical protein
MEGLLHVVSMDKDATAAQFDPPRT